MEIIKLSQRLLTVERMITDGNIVADIGTDHGYLPIHLIQSGKTQNVIAMDVRKGPLEKAKSNVREYEVSGNIEIRLSDGLERLEKDEAGTITICGMGGKLISRILDAGRDRLTYETELILSPQSEISQFREYLMRNGYITIMEEMIFEDGKYYVIIKCRLGNITEDIGNIPELYLKYGVYLLEHRNDILKQYILKEKNKLQRIMQTVKVATSDNVEDRIKELDRELQCVEEGLKYYEM